MWREEYRMNAELEKEQIKRLICSYVQEYQKKQNVITIWGKPLVGFADANHPYIQSLPDIIRTTHALPSDVLKDASIVIAYYVPFTKELAKTNKRADDLASPDWALAYEETNAMFEKLNTYIINCLEKMGYRGSISPKAATFDQKELKSDWSHRHFAYAAGLGTFGLNNMLITKRGCCGRYSTIVTNLDVKPDAPASEEYCLYKKNGSCGVCVKNCPMGALKLDSFDRNKCYVMLRKNAELYTEFGSSYTDESGENANSVGSEVCGKCVTQSPCAFF